MEKKINYIKENWVNVAREGWMIWPMRIEKKREKDGAVKLKGWKTYCPYGATEDGYTIEKPEYGTKTFDTVLHIARLDAVKEAMSYIFELDEDLIQMIGEKLKDQLLKDIERDKAERGGDGMMCGEKEVIEALTELF